MFFNMTGCAEDIYLDLPGNDKWKVIELPCFVQEPYEIEFYYSVACCPDGSLIIGCVGRVHKLVGENKWEYYTVTSRNALITEIVNNGEGLLFAALSPGGVFVSNDNGETWRQINNKLSNIYVNDLVVGLDGSLFAGTDEGDVFITHDNGEQWSFCGSDSFSSDVTALEIDSEGVLYAGTDGNGVFKTEDNKKWSVPKVLLSGHHKKIEDWRKKHSKKI